MLNISFLLNKLRWSKIAIFYIVMNRVYGTHKYTNNTLDSFWTNKLLLY